PLQRPRFKTCVTFFTSEYSFRKLSRTRCVTRATEWRWVELKLKPAPGQQRRTRILENDHVSQTNSRGCRCCFPQPDGAGAHLRFGGRILSASSSPLGSWPRLRDRLHRWRRL